MYPPKVFAVAFKRCSFTRGFNDKALTEKFLVVWIDGRSERWIRRVLTNCEPASQRASESCESCESSCEREPCETNVSSCLSMCCITKMPRNSFIIPFSPSQMTLHLDHLVGVSARYEARFKIRDTFIERCFRRVCSQ